MNVESLLIEKLNLDNNFTTTEKYISKKIKKNLAFFLYSKIQDISIEFEVSTSSLFRFINKIGFESFSDFREWIRVQQIISSNEYSLVNSVKKTISKLIRYDFTEFKKIVNKNSYLIITGTGSSKFIAQSFSSKLTKSGFKSRFLLIEDFNEIKAMTNNLTIIVISFSGKGMLDLDHKLKSLNKLYDNVPKILISATKPKYSVLDLVYLTIYGDTNENWDFHEQELPTNSEIICLTVINEILKIL